MRVKKAVIAAGGLGTRFLPVTKYLPKEMLPVLNKPVIQHSIEEAVAAGVETVIIVVSAGKKSIIEYFSPDIDLEGALQANCGTPLRDEITKLSSLSRMADLRYVTQETPRGLGHAVLMAEEMVGNEPFLLFLPDDLFEQGVFVVRELVRILETLGGSVVAVKTVSDTEVDRYGVIEPKHLYDHTYQVLSMVEKPPRCEAPSNLAIMGRYALTPDVFSALRELPPGRNGEVQLTDALQMLLAKGKVFAYAIEGERYDCGTVPGWIETNLALALRDPSMGPALRAAVGRLRERGEL